jgi:hypothetical protein
MGEIRNAYKILVGKLEATRALGMLGVDRKTILEWILRKQGGDLWTGCIWLRIRTIGGLY